MKQLTRSVIYLFNKILPSPFTIAILLSAFTYFLAITLTTPTNSDYINYGIELLLFWKDGLWYAPLLVFAMQMMLMLVLGYVVALSKPIDNLIQQATKYCNNTANAVALITFSTILVGLFNWGLGLIYGAIFAKKIGDHSKQKNIPLNYPLIGAAGYVALLVWHGGLSGSAPIKISEAGHFLEAQTGQIFLSDTIFSPMNIFISIALLLILPAGMYLMGKRTNPTQIETQKKIELTTSPNIEGAEILDYSIYLSYSFAFIILGLSIYIAYISIQTDGFNLSFLNPNYINFLLLGLAVVLHKNFHNFLQAVEKSINGASGILIQFPLYFGIMAIMNHSGLVDIFSNFFVSISNNNTFPIFTFISAGIVNIFVPSGGGQWTVQGPIIAKAANELNIPMAKCVMALAYGDQATNMLQPFWALPLLGITGLKAKEILPYTLYMMIIACIIFVTGLIIF